MDVCVSTEPGVRIRCEHDAQADECRRAALVQVESAVEDAREAESAAIEPYLEPAPAGEGFDQFRARLERARQAYFAEYPGAREAHVAREAAATVVYNLRYGHDIRREDLELALGFRWKNVSIVGVDALAIEGGEKR